VSSRWPGRVALALVAGGLAFVAGRAFLDHRAEDADEAAKPGRPDEVLGYVLKRSYQGRHATDEFDVLVRTNALGLRDNLTLVGKLEGTYRVLVTGDSFAYGWGVEMEEAWPWRLERALDSDERPVEVVNAGVPGWSPDHVWVWLTTRGFAFEPDLLVVQLCSNDLQDLGWDELTLDEDNLPTRIGARKRLSRERRRRLLEGLAAERGVSVAELRGTLEPSEVHDLVAMAIEQERREREGEPAPQGPIASMSHAQIERGLRGSADFQLRYLEYLVDAIARACEERGVPLRLVLIDDGTQPGSAAVARLHERASAFPAPCLDADDVLPGAPREALFFEDDPHWRPAAHARFAEAVARWLREDPALGLSP